MVNGTDKNSELHLTYNSLIGHMLHLTIMGSYEYFY